jgi:phospholipid/cholesterol/gamma-HCH transport system permease protein
VALPIWRWSVPDRRVVLAYLISRLRFSADAFIINILGISLIRELGWCSPCLIAGRSGRPSTTQIGVMRVTEEIDAMRVMGVPGLCGDAARHRAGVEPYMISVWTDSRAAAACWRPMSRWA